MKQMKCAIVTLGLLACVTTAPLKSDSLLSQQPPAAGMDEPMTSSPSAGSVEVVTPEDCAFYRQGGPLRSERIVVYQQPAYLTDKDYYWTTINYRDEYLDKRTLAFQPLDRRSDGTMPPKNNDAFTLDIATGEPQKDGLFDPDRARGKRPQDYTHSTLLVSAHAYERTPERVIGIYSRSRSYRVDEDFVGHMEGGFFVHANKPTYIRTGSVLVGFERILVPDGAPETGEFFIRTGAGGEVSSVLQCDTLQYYPNPLCTLFENVGIFKTEVYFSRRFLSLIDAIRSHSRRFTACLTVQNAPKN
ncbi:MAG: hypothetical protein JWM36_952 [Hyphomicrobiales bacterium]|nr:hypothetical protein [Hyphomicrobiales bacterium]